MTKCEAARCENPVAFVVSARGDLAPVCVEHVEWARDLFYPRKVLVARFVVVAGVEA